MSELRQRREPIRSRAYLDGARGENCKLRFPGCPNDRDTVVACHVHDKASFGMGQKADDLSIIDGDHYCHQYLDLHSHEMSRALLLEYLLRGIQETIRNRVERGILKVKLDPDTTFGNRPAKPRKPPEQRASIPSRPMPSKGRKLASRNTLRRKDRSDA